MKHLKCPVCDCEYSKEVNQVCPTCSW
ncbi:MAG: hypothetical protein RLZZ29_1775, partial [Cyanobacteriota bacterium]